MEKQSEPINTQEMTAIVQHEHAKKDDIEENLTKTFKNKILSEFIFPDVAEKISEARWKQQMWNILAGIFITIKYLCVSASMFFVFSSSSALFVDKQQLFALIGGLLHVSSLVCEGLGKYFTSNGKNTLKNKNELLRSLGAKYREPNTAFQDPLSKSDDSDSDSDKSNSETTKKDKKEHTKIEIK